MALSSTEFRVFIPTTFRNMHAERDVIANDVIPALREHCIGQRLGLVIQDGRWGIVEAQTKGRDVVATCLDAIALKRPIVLGIVGEARGGEKHPWLAPAGDDVETMDLDLIESLLDNPFTADRTFFYFREETPRPVDATAETNGRYDRLHHLKQRIRRSALPVRHYTTPESLGHLMLQDLLTELERYRAAGHGTPTLMLERRAHAAFASSRRKGYVSIGDYTRRLSACLKPLTGRARNVAIVGPPGAGKSALAAYWAESIRNREGVILIEHYVGHSPQGNDARAVLRHILLELKEECKIPDQFPVDLEQMAHALRTWPAYAQQRTVVILIDALNQLDPESQDLRWLTDVEFPANVRLIVTTLPEGTAYAELDGGRWTPIEMKPLTLDQRWKIVERYLAREGKPLADTQLQRLSGNAIATTPLFLRTIIEELQIDGSFAEANRHLREYLSANTLQDLFRMILERLEQHEEFGPQLVQDVTSFIWVSRRGLSASELFGIIWPSAPRMSEGRRKERRKILDRLLDRLSSYLIEHEGRFRFFHDQFAAAVEGRYLDSFGSQRRRHVRLAQYFGAPPVTSRTAEEAPYQWMMARKSDLATCVTDIDMVMALGTEEHRLDLLRYWRTIKATNSIADTYLNALAASRSAELFTTTRIVELLQCLGDMFNQAALFPAAALVLERALHHTGDGAAAIRTRLLLSTTYHQLGRLDDAEALLLRLSEAGAFGDDSGNRILLLDALNSLARLYYAGQKYREAQEVLERARPISMEIHGNDHPETLGILSLMGAVSLAMGNYHASEYLFRSVLEKCRQCHHTPHPDTSSALSNVAAALRAQSAVAKRTGNAKGIRLKEAISLVQEALAIDEQVYGEHHSETAFKLNNLGTLYRLDDQPEQAEPCYDRALGILIEVYDEGHFEVANCRNNRGTLYANTERFPRAEKEFTAALEIRRAKFGPDNVMTIGAELNLAWLAYKRGDHCNAVRLYEEALPKKRKVSGDDHPETLQSIAVYEEASARCREQRATE